MSKLPLATPEDGQVFTVDGQQYTATADDYAVGVVAFKTGSTDPGTTGGGNEPLVPRTPSIPDVLLAGMYVRDYITTNNNVVVVRSFNNRDYYLVIDVMSGAKSLFDTAPVEVTS